MNEMTVHPEPSDEERGAILAALRPPAADLPAPYRSGWRLAALAEVADP
jgi:hypothetical protein